jgi:hypothetical protein
VSGEGAAAPAPPGEPPGAAAGKNGQAGAGAGKSEQPGGGGAAGKNDQPGAGGAAAAGKKADGSNFGSAARNPLGSDARATQHAYRSGRQNLRIIGPGAVIDEGHFQDFQIGDRVNYFIGSRLTLTPGPVRPDLLDWLRSRYTPVPSYPQLVDTLRRRRVVVLRGLPNTGRSTTALYGLDEIAGGNVSRLDQIDDLRAIEVKNLTPGHGYLAELPRSVVGQAPMETQLDRLSALLTDHGCYCVLLAESTARQWDSLGGYCVTCVPPEPFALLTKHIARQMRRDDEDGLEQRLLDLARSPEVKEAWGPCPRPAETVALAQLLVEHGRGAITLAELQAGCLRAVHHQVVEWFTDLGTLEPGEEADNAMRLAGFRIALAVLNESPLHIVREAGERLARELMLTIWPRRTPGRPLFSDDRDNWLVAARARVENGYADVGEAMVPVGLVDFEDRRFPVAVLTYLWQRHHNMRAPLVSWLRELGNDLRPVVWVRAAQAAGLLCALDFPYTFYELLSPGAGAEDERQRRFVAVALDQAALHTGVRKAVETQLRRWRRFGTYEERWTVAAALGYDLGMRSVHDTLNELRILGTTAEYLDDEADGDEDLQGLVLEASHSVTRLFAQGAVPAVVQRLNEWIMSKRRTLRELALYTVLLLANTRVGELWEQDILAGSDRRRSIAQERQQWPLLLALQEEDPALAVPFADLLWRTMRGPAGAVLSDILGGWMQISARDPACLDALAKFVPLLVGDGQDVRRLRYLVQLMRKDWAEPLDAAVATRLEAAIDRPVAQETAP